MSQSEESVITLYNRECRDIQGIILSYLKDLVETEKRKNTLIMLNAEFIYKTYDSYMYFKHIPVTISMSNILPVVAWQGALAWPTVYNALKVYNIHYDTEAIRLPNTVNLDIFDDYMLHKMSEDIMFWSQMFNDREDDFMESEYYFTPRNAAIEIIIEGAAEFGVPKRNCPFSFKFPIFNTKE